MPADVSVRAVAAGVLAGLLFAASPSLAQDAVKGSDVFQSRCSQCHVLNGVGQGPSLIGIVGRRAAVLPGYPYSGGLKASGLTWTPSNLDAFVQGPTKLVPGTAMRVVVADPNDRRDLIAYLATLKR
jgi:cytochrome c